jgi:tetratricopeptide (TPR) repeat protein
MAAMTRRQTVALAAAGTLAVASGMWLWHASRRLPVAETRAFLAEPLDVGETAPPPPPPPAAAGAAEIARRHEEARAAFAAGNYPEAATGFAWVVAQDPGGPLAGPAQWNLTRSRLRSGDATGALGALRDLLQHQSGYLAAESPSLGDGLQRMDQGDLPGAQAAFERMIHEQPDSELVPLAHALIARIHWAHGEPMETVRAFARMLGSVRDAVPAYARLAHYLKRYADGDANMPDTFADLAQTGDEGFKDVYQYLAARSLLEQGRFEATHAALETLRARYPGGDFTHIVDLEEAWNLLRNGKADEALAIFERLEQTPAPANAQGFDEFFDLRAELPMGIARCQLALGHDQEAATAFERALASTDRSIYVVENRVGLAAAYERLGRLDRAAAELRRVIDEHPDEPSGWALRQQLARVEERLARAPTP